MNLFPSHCCWGKEHPKRFFVVLIELIDILYLYKYIVIFIYRDTLDIYFTCIFNVYYVYYTYYIRPLLYGQMLACPPFQQWQVKLYRKPLQEIEHSWHPDQPRRAQGTG